MAARGLSATLQQVSACLAREDGDSLSRTLGVVDSTPGPSQALGAMPSASSIEAACATSVLGEFAAWVAPALQARANYLRGEHAAALQKLVDASPRLCSLWTGRPWLAPLACALARDLRFLALLANQGQADKSNLEKCEPAIKKLFTTSFNDKSSDFWSSRQQASLYLIVQLFKVYFRLGNLHQGKSLVQSVSSPRFPDLHNFPKAHRVAYRYFHGRLLLFQERHVESADALMAALRECPTSCPRNKRRILEYLVPAKMLAGSLPDPRLLHRHGLHMFTDLAHALRTGDLGLFQTTLRDNEGHFIQQGTLLVLENLFGHVLRTLVKHVTTVSNEGKDSAHLLHLDNVLVALRLLGCDFDMDEVECMLATLISKRFIRGYVHHGRHILVLARSKAFPPIRDVVRPNADA